MVPYRVRYRLVHHLGNVMSAHRTPNLWTRVRKFISNPELRRAWGNPASFESPDIKPDERYWDETDADLIRLLRAEVSRVTPLRASHWLMGPGWYQDVRDMQNSGGHRTDAPPVDQAGRALLYGIPVRVSPWAGVPMLVPYKLG